MLCVLQIATWLVKARAQDVMLVRLPLGGPQQQQQQVHQSQHAGGRGGKEECVVLATAVSQRHAYACAEAVRYQVGVGTRWELGGAEGRGCFRPWYACCACVVVYCQPRDLVGHAVRVQLTVLHNIRKLQFRTASWADVVLPCLTPSIRTHEAGADPRRWPACAPHP